MPTYEWRCKVCNIIICVDRRVDKRMMPPRRFEHNCDKTRPRDFDFHVSVVSGKFPGADSWRK